MKLTFAFFKKNSRKSRRRKAGVLRETFDPPREWSTSLLVVMVTALGLFAYTGFDFYEQFYDTNMPVVTEEHVPRYRAADAESIIRYYSGRRESFDILRANAPVVTPPVETPVQPVIPPSETDSEEVVTPVIAE